MPRLREAKIPFGCQVFLTLLKIMNVAIIGGCNAKTSIQKLDYKETSPFISFLLLFGALTVVLSFEINPTPTFSPGWLLIFLGATTMLGGFTGFGGTTLPCCYKSHLILMSIVIFSTIIFCLVMFGQRSKVVASFQSTRFPEATVDHYIAQLSWAYVFVIIVEGVAVVARIFYQRIANQTNQAQFETVSQTQDFRNETLGQMRQDLGGRSNRVDQTKAAALDSRIKDKYDK